MPPFQVLLKGSRSVQIRSATSRHPRDQEMLLVRNPSVFVVYDLTSPTKPHPILHLPPYPERGQRLIRRRKQRQPIWQGSRRVRPVQDVDHSIRRGDGRGAEEGPRS